MVKYEGTCHVRDLSAGRLVTPLRYSGNSITEGQFLNIHLCTCLLYILLTVAVITGGVAMVLHIRIVFATSLTETDILPVLTISTSLFVCATPCKLDVFEFVQCKRKS